MKINSVKTYILGSIFSGCSALMSGCGVDGDDMRGLHEYMSEKGQTQIELNEVEQLTKRTNPISTHFARQSALDSMAFLDLFNSTQLTKDSNIIAEFNRVASMGKLEVLNINDYSNVRKPALRKFIANLTNDSTSISTVDSLIENFPDPKSWHHYNIAEIQDFQRFSDEYFYGKFFKDYNLSDSNFIKRFKRVAKKIKPRI